MSGKNRKTGKTAAEPADQAFPISKVNIKRHPFFNIPDIIYMVYTCSESLQILRSERLCIEISSIFLQIGTAV
ncbi:MAG: hypothetical protein RIR26_1680 [Pseudomonadota bacterium]